MAEGDGGAGPGDENPAGQPPPPTGAPLSGATPPGPPAQQPGQAPQQPAQPAQQPGPYQQPQQQPAPPRFQAQQPAQSQAGPTAGGGWYAGPIPIAGLAPRETIGSAIGRTAVKAITLLIILGIGFVLIPILLIGALFAAGGGEVDGPGRGLVVGEPGADISLVAVPVRGVILGEDTSGGGSLFSPVDVTYGYTVAEELAELAEDDSVDGVILEVDSPGGTIFGSRAIADAVTAYQEATDNPVIAYVSGISASGGVYSMAGADAIYADHGTLIGSIGVIFGPFTTYDDVRAIDGGLLGGGVTTEGGIDVEFLTAGRSKDFGNPYRPMTDEERAVLQEGLDDAYADFVNHVSEGRDIPAADIEKELGALIFGEQQAVANGLIDGIANRDATYALAAEAAGLSGAQTFKVERLETAEPSLASLFARRLAGEDGTTPPADATVGTLTPLCLGTGSLLAYHGDPAQLCTPGR